MVRTTLAAVCVNILLSLPAQAATYYVSTTGKDTDAGTEAAPFATWDRAQTAVAPGDTVYFHGGRYAYTTATSTCSSTSATVDSIVLSKSGTAGNPINYFAAPGEKPVFDFSGVTDTAKYNCRHTGVRVTGSWLHLKGLEFTGALQLNNLNHESWGFYVYGGSNNIFEQLDSHHHMGPGFFLQRGGNNLFLNCDSHENEDTLTSNGDGQSADGFGCHPNRTGDTGNVFRGCRAWWNSDDNWDMINATEACIVENSWAWYAGYKPDELSGGKTVSLSAGNGNGFKGGGYGLNPVTLPSGPVPQHIIRFNVAVQNKDSGFYANHSPNNAYFYNNTGYSNGTDFNMLGVASDLSASSSVGFLRNNIAFGGSLTSNMGLAGSIDDKYNSWDADLGITVSNADFGSVAFSPPASCPAAYSPGGTVCVPPTDTTSFAGMASARQADGSLPILPFLRLAAGSKLIDKGSTTGLPTPYPVYVGPAPDLGAFEYGATGGVSGGGGSSGTGGASGSGGVSGKGGTSGGGGTLATGGAGGTTGSASNGGSGSGGTLTAMGGTDVVGTGGVLGSGGAQSGGTTGSAGAGGASTAGGAGGTKSGSGGAATGGTLAGVGGAGSGGVTSSGAGGSGGFLGASGSSVSIFTGGTGGGGTTGVASSGGSAGSTAGGGASSGCGCRIGGSTRGGEMVLLALPLLFFVLRRRRRR